MKSDDHVSNETSAVKESSPKKRKRPRTKRAPKHAPPLSGLILAISTLDVKRQTHNESESSFSTVSDLCKTAGATISNQVHKKVSFLICNPSAVENATQRVRKALKKGIPLVNVSWVRECVAQKQRINDEPYRLDEMARKIVEAKQKQKQTDQGEEGGAKGNDELMNGIPDEAWSEPVSLGCCCVCHENGAADCPWCEDCELTKARKRQKKS